MSSIGLEFVFHAYVTISKELEIGPVSTGIRNIAPITGGTFEGKNLKGIVVPGGAEWQLIRADGIMEVEAKYTLKTDDNALIYVMNNGIINLQELPPTGYARTCPKFEVSHDKYTWLCKSLFVSTITPMVDEATPMTLENKSMLSAVSVNFYRVT